MWPYPNCLIRCGFSPPPFERGFLPLSALRHLLPKISSTCTYPWLSQTQNPTSKILTTSFLAAQASSSHRIPLRTSWLNRQNAVHGSTKSSILAGFRPGWILSRLCLGRIVSEPPCVNSWKIANLGVPRLLGRTPFTNALLAGSLMWNPWPEISAGWPTAALLLAGVRESAERVSSSPHCRS